MENPQNSKEQYHRKWWRLSEWGFSAYERRAIWFLILILSIGSGVRFYKSSKLNQDLHLQLELGSAVSDAIHSPPLPSSSPKNLVNINTASHDELETLPGIGPARARSIISYRETHGAFEEVGDLTQVPGIGEATIRKLNEFTETGENTDHVISDSINHADE